MSDAADTPPSEDTESRHLGEVDWSRYATNVCLTESTRETGEVPATVPDALYLDGKTVEVQRGSWAVTCTGNGVATVVANVRARDVEVARPGGKARPRVFIGGVRVLTTDDAVPDVGKPAGSWLTVRFYAPHIRVTPHGAT
jgi:hypothetical protein